MPVGAALVIDIGGNRPRLRGRVIDHEGNTVVLSLGGDRRAALFASDIVRARVVPGRLDDGDLVVRFGVPENVWRGGILRHDGQRVYVETLDGLAWMDEDELESADERAAMRLELPEMSGSAL